VRHRQSSLYRAQRLAEYALYDGDPNLFNTELERYLSVTPEQIKEAVARYLDTENRVVLDIIPAGITEEEEEAAATEEFPTAAASTHVAGEPQQPAAPPPQVPPAPPAAPQGNANRPATGLNIEGTHPEQPQQPADAPAQTEPGAQG
jgi:hypothetical protein